METLIGKLYCILTIFLYVIRPSTPIKSVLGNSYGTVSASMTMDTYKSRLLEVTV